MIGLGLRHLGGVAQRCCTLCGLVLLRVRRCSSRQLGNVVAFRKLWSARAALRSAFALIFVPLVHLTADYLCRAQLGVMGNFFSKPTKIGAPVLLRDWEPHQDPTLTVTRVETETLDGSQGTDSANSSTSRSFVPMHYGEQPLYRLTPTIDIDSVYLELTMRLKAENANVYPIMWVTLKKGPFKGPFFSKGLDCVAQAGTGWQRVTAPFWLKRDQVIGSVLLALFVTPTSDKTSRGERRVWFSDVQLHGTPLSWARANDTPALPQWHLLTPPVLCGENGDAFATPAVVAQ